MINSDGKLQSYAHLHAFQWWEIKHGQIQDEMDGTIWFLDPQNIVLDTKIIILYALVQELWMTKNAFSLNGGKHNIPVKRLRSNR